MCPPPLRPHSSSPAECTVVRFQVDTIRDVWHTTLQSRRRKHLMALQSAFIATQGQKVGKPKCNRSILFYFLFALDLHHTQHMRSKDKSHKLVLYYNKEKVWVVYWESGGAVGVITVPITLWSNFFPTYDPVSGWRLNEIGVTAFIGFLYIHTQTITAYSSLIMAISM